MYSHLTSYVATEQTTDSIRRAALDAARHEASPAAATPGRTRRVRWLHTRPARQAARA